MGGKDKAYQKSYKSGYEYLLAYKITVPIYDYTVEFCRRWIRRGSRTYDQMEQAARSGTQNVAEGSTQESLSTYIALVGVARGSQEELLKDYLSFGRQRRLAIWPREKAVGEIREIGEIWEILRKTPTIPDYPNFPNLPLDPETAVNLLVTLINQANYLLDKLSASLKDKHTREGGFRENLLKKRLAYRSGAK